MGCIAVNTDPAQALAEEPANRAVSASFSLGTTPGAMPQAGMDCAGGAPDTDPCVCYPESQLVETRITPAVTNRIPVMSVALSRSFRKYAEHTAIRMTLRS